MKKSDPPPFDQEYADRQMELRRALNEYQVAPANSTKKVQAWFRYKELLQAAKDSGEHR